MLIDESDSCTDYNVMKNCNLNIFFSVLLKFWITIPGVMYDKHLVSCIYDKLKNK